MEIKRNGSQPSSKGPADWFTGTVRIDPLFEANDPARALRRQRHVRAAALPNTDAVDSLRRDRILSPSKDARDLPITRSHHHRPMQPVYICEKLAKVVELSSSQKRD